MSQLRPFRVEIPEKALADLRARLAATRWTDDVFNGDERYGVSVSYARALCEHWQRSDWRALEARVNREANVLTGIDGLTLHAVHRPSARKDATPLVLLHGWPSSFLEFLDLCGPLADAGFHVVIPSLPGYGFSTTRPGLTPQAIAPMIVELMVRLGYPRFMVHGGNWGAVVGTEMARDYPDRVLGLHLTSVNGTPPADRENIPLNADEQAWLAAQKQPAVFPHYAVLSQTPASLAHALNDSPAGLAAWVGEKLRDWSDNLTLDQMVATIALYWFTGTIGASGLLYYEHRLQPPPERFVNVPTAGAIFPKGLVRIPRGWAERHFNIVQWNTFDCGGHFPAMEAPDLLTGDLRQFAKAVRT